MSLATDALEAVQQLLRIFWNRDSLGGMQALARCFRKHHNALRLFAGVELADESVLAWEQIQTREREPKHLMLFGCCEALSAHHLLQWICTELLHCFTTVDDDPKECFKRLLEWLPDDQPPIEMDDDYDFLNLHFHRLIKHEEIKSRQHRKSEAVAVSQSSETRDVPSEVVTDLTQKTTNTIRKAVDNTRDAMRRAIAKALENAQPLIKEEYAKYNQELAESGLPSVDPDEDIEKRARRLLRMAGRPDTDFGELTSADVEQIARDFADQEIKAAIDRKRVKKRAAEIAEKVLTDQEVQSDNVRPHSEAISQQLNTSPIKDSWEDRVERAPEDADHENPLIPIWDPDARRFTFGDDSYTFVRRLKQAKDVLDAFQASDWQSKISLRNDATFRKAAIRTLKKLESMVRFEFGTDTDTPNTVCWRPATSAQSAPPNRG